MSCARCCGARSVRSCIIADEPDIELAEPAPMSSRMPSTAGRPLVITSPVPNWPAAVMSVPQRIKGFRPTVSAKRPSGRFTASLAKAGAEMSKPVPAAPRPISVASSGNTGTTCATPMFSIICEPTRMPTSRRSATSSHIEPDEEADFEPSSARGGGCPDMLRSPTRTGERC